MPVQFFRAEAGRKETCRCDHCPQLRHHNAAGPDREGILGGLKAVTVGTLAEVEALIAVSGLRTVNVGTLAELNVLVNITLGVAPFVLLMRVTSAEYDPTRAATEYDDTQDKD